MNIQFWLYFGLAFLGAIVLGVILTLIVYFIATKIDNKKAIKQMPKEELEEIIKVTKPLSERRITINNDTTKLRQFERLRRTTEGTQPTDSFYARKFEDERRSSISDGVSKQPELDSKSTTGEQPSPVRKVKFD